MRSTPLSWLYVPGPLRYCTSRYPLKATAAGTEITTSPLSTARPTYSTMASADTPTSDDVQASNSGGGQTSMLARNRAQQEADAQGQKAPPRSQYFPLTYREGLSQWWASLPPAATEHKVLSFIPYLEQLKVHTHTGTKAGGKLGEEGMDVDGSQQRDAAPVRTNRGNDPYGPRVWHSNLVQLSGKNRYLNEFSVERVGEEGEPNSLVMIHGYGAGLGFFYKNFEHLSRLPHWRLYALDLLGMGRSSRPPFRIHAKEKEEKVREAENWFIDALEEWRIKRGIEKMTLLGHSLGGYMAVCYALKYPGHLNKLILASPVGVPEDPYAVNEEMPDQSGSKAGAGSDNARRRPYSKWLTTLWDANISPFSFVRLSGPLGPRLVSGWTSRRFGHLPLEESQALHDYSYSLFRQKGSGEYALAYILAPGAFARSPLIRRIQGVGRQYLQPHDAPRVDGAASDAGRTGQINGVLRVRETGIPIVFMYGDKDWMDVNGGLDSKKILDAEKRKALENASEREKLLENGDVTVKVIKNAGHHLYLEGDKEFNAFMEKEMRDVELRQKSLAAVEKA